MNYLFFGTENFLIKKEINNIKHNENIDDLSVTYYDFDNSSIIDIIDDASTIPLFSEKKMIICNNATVFTSTSKKAVSEEHIEKLIKYIENPNPLTILIFQNDTIDNKRKAVTRMKKNGIVKEFNKADNLNKLVAEMFEGYSINSSAINLLINRVGKNINILKQESDKIKTFKINEKEITNEDIINCTDEKVDGNVFDLIDNITSGNKNKALSIYNELLKHNESPIKIIVLLSNYYRTLYQTKILLSKGHSEREAATILEANPYYISQVLKKGKNITPKKAIEYLSLLADLDYNIKIGKVDQITGLEFFIIEN